MSIRKDNLDRKTAKAYEAWRKEFSVEDLLKYTEGGKTYPLKDVIAELEEMETRRTKQNKSKKKGS
ncbi:MAG: hypothetical protein JNJ77_19250 [Planctomycetia bacterium]|nr:hypothetical protein [Planctomycetia bacterium]